LLGSLGTAVAVAGYGELALAQAAKVSQEAARYQNEPKDGKACAQCRFFKAPNACERVEGDISPNGWCSFWAAKS
jgi:hypothetical protein